MKDENLRNKLCKAIAECDTMSVSESDKCKAVTIFNHAWTKVMKEEKEGEEMQQKTKEIIQVRVEELTGYINRNINRIKELQDFITKEQEQNKNYEEEIKQLLMDLNRE